ncbi:hypothetical protein I2I05_07315 [Hymenobacter sp. BT683]|uniref:DUF2306 domain-containing protein n=1 Tax=Hymenobacter jeongseonensis TaxID=2791027 RepID=A0ABS0IFS6_9BACT|nr:hypothetical protein [Hymenobacter jeongseonensis]MBF9237202.1 hypothetical protein [Hymenobacter jeongseonensis]
METLHHFNIGLHIVSGSLALLLGLGPLLVRKGGAAHVRLGHWFLRVMAVVLLTAVLGLAVFNFRPFLLTVVLLSVYQAWSGYRVLRTRDTGPTAIDAAVTLAFLVGSVGFLVGLNRSPLVWSPVVIYSTMGYLAALLVYDLARFRFRKWWRHGGWLYDHLWKMIGSYFALVAAFTGTVLPQFKPYSQFLPSMLGMAMQVGFVLYYGRLARRRAALLA